MKKLKNKVFFTIFTLLSTFLLTILFIYNYQNYNQEYRNINNNLKRINRENTELKKDFNIPDKPNFDNDNKKLMFMDSDVYSVKLNANNEIEDITSHSINNEQTDKIEKIAKEIIISKKSKKTYIGNLYTNKYSYHYSIGKSITIIDNTDVNKRLTNILILSIVIFITLEIIIFIVSKLITNWIIKPVINSFNKQKQFIADASHELKTPLAVIMASSESLENDSNNKWIKNIQNESERMNKLITSLLDLAKLDSEEVKREDQKNNLSKIIEKSTLTFESITFEKGINLDYSIDKDIYYNCNSDDVKEVMSILLDNATKHCSKDGKIDVRLKNNKNDIVITVSNTGDPIPKGEEEKIFERFYRVDKARNRKENRYGLGLSIAKKIVENHNGNISANSNNGITTFKIILKK